ncbi:MAG: flagellar basal body P-ring protein FlgI [Acidobacteriia bacterium]|nr:flagellar basal body P-ring protein FlgI [Terriglobia bacterium]
MKQLGILLAVCASLLHAEGTTRLKELATVQGVRDNQLVGYGLVVGLNGTGDRQQTIFSTQSLANLLQQMGVSVPALLIRVKNTASVMVTATLPAFTQPGSRIDLNVGAMGDASNLQGGLLVLTSLRGVDGQVYVTAQGSVVTGGFAAGKGGNTASVNFPTAGRIPNGGLVERPAPSVTPTGNMNLQLNHPDFTTASRISAVINKKFGKDGAPMAKAESSGTITINIPKEYNAHETDFIAELERLQVETDRVARVVVNERTGTIIMGKEVRVSPVAIMHGNLTVEIQTTQEVSQPAPLSQGQTAVVPQTTVNASEEKSRNLVLSKGATVEELVHALGAIGSTPRDVIAILQSLRAAGALEADLEVI